MATSEYSRSSLNNSPGKSFDRGRSGPTSVVSSSLWLGDCLDIAQNLPRGAFRLLYLDPPFLTGKTRIGSDERFAYADSWPDHLDGYLPWLRARLEAVLPLLCTNGSLILHLDWRVSHHGRQILDDLCGAANFQNEIIWHYTGGGRSRSRFSRKHDSLLWYSRSAKPVFHLDAVRVPYQKTSGFAKSGIVSRAGRKYLPNPDGTPLDDVWHIPIINPMSTERVGYPTQKPLALLRRLITALSSPGELVGDFFCGSGTALVAAVMEGRQCAGGDISSAAVDCTRDRLGKCGVGVEVRRINCDRMNARLPV